MKIYYFIPTKLNSEKTSLTYLMSEKGLQIQQRVNLFYSSFISDYIDRTSPIPFFNPVQDEVFKCGIKPKDIYYLFGKLDRHLIVSNNLFNILIEYNLSDYVAFDDVQIKDSSNTIHFHKYLSFYKNIWDYADFTKCRFMIYSEDRKRVISYNERFNDFEEFYERSKVESIRPKEVVIRSLNNFDLFTLFNLSGSSFFISERLYLTLKNNKISGADIGEFKGWNFSSI